jgi:hypothetical protein
LKRQPELDCSANSDSGSQICNMMKSLIDVLKCYVSLK